VQRAGILDHTSLSNDVVLILIFTRACLFVCLFPGHGMQ